MSINKQRNWNDVYVPNDEYYRKEDAILSNELKQFYNNIKIFPTKFNTIEEKHKYFNRVYQRHIHEIKEDIKWKHLHNCEMIETGVALIIPHEYENEYHTYCKKKQSGPTIFERLKKCFN